jgi:hypothetical protein
VVKNRSASDRNLYLGPIARDQALFPSLSQFDATFLLGCTRGGSPGIFGVPHP